MEMRLANWLAGRVAKESQPAFFCRNNRMACTQTHMLYALRLSILKFGCRRVNQPIDKSSSVLEQKRL